MPLHEMINEGQIRISVSELACALRIVWQAHSLVNALLDEKPRAELIRRLVIELDKFDFDSMGLELDGDGSAFRIVSEYLQEEDWQHVTLDPYGPDLVFAVEAEPAKAQSVDK